MLIGFKRLTDLWHEGRAGKRKESKVRIEDSADRCIERESGRAALAAERMFGAWIATGLVALGSPARSVLAA
jgi:hypothetical protein